MMKKLVGMVLGFGVLLSASVISDTVYAQYELVNSTDSIYCDDFIISPMSLYTQYTYTTLSIASGVANANATLMGYSGLTTSVSITMYLEKKILWWWSIQETWSQTFTGYSGTLFKSLGVSGGTYRVRAVYVAYNGNNSETLTGMSGDVKN